MSDRLGKQDFYRYLQLRDYLCKEVKGSNPREPPIIIHLFFDAYNLGSAKGLISKLYHGITSLNTDTTDYVRQRWETELDIDITEAVCLNAWQTVILPDLERLLLEKPHRFFITSKQKSKQTGTQLCC